MEKKVVRVLLLEDNPSDVEIVRDALDRAQEEQYVLSHAWRLKEAVEKLRTDAFDVVIADLLVPDSMGLETLTELRRESPRMPIVVCTGTTDQETGAEAVRRGAQDYLVKGRITSRFVRRALRYAMERKIVENQLDDLTGTLHQQVAERTTDLERTLSSLQDEHRAHLVAQEMLRRDERRGLERVATLVEQLSASGSQSRPGLVEEIQEELRQLTEANRLGQEMLCGGKPNEEELRRKSGSEQEHPAGPVSSASLR
jgi:DNA-binding NarL/FixJ family response regulator